MINLSDIRATLLAELGKGKNLPCHVAAFCAWIMADNDRLRQCADEAIGFTGQARHPEHVAALGYGAVNGLLSPEECKLFRDEIAHLSGRAFFAAGRPLRFEVDGIALLGVSLGIGALVKDMDSQWLKSLLTRSANEVSGDPWQLGLVRAGKLSIGETNLRIVPPELAVAMHARNVGELHNHDIEASWALAVGLTPHDAGPARDAVRLFVFDYVLARQGQISIAGTTREDLASLLENVSRSMRHWTFESQPRTSKSTIAKWEVENEYHVQNLLWAVLAPVFSDLEDEENLPSVGHKNPRADLGIPSLKTIIEVKFMRNAGQAACAKIIEEIAADASLYLSPRSTYDNIIAFVWDDCAQTEQHHELKTGLATIKGITAAIILPRPSKMARPSATRTTKITS
tara:strand:- start:275 stop:1474 length:1200 start_codon:yes stop_codon:yes gene_type:complete